jgi:plasmid stabilization system protein ParE
MAVVESMIERLQEFPNAWSVIFDDIRRARLKKFKQYSIRYRFFAEDETSRILTITHSSQHPDTDRDRL